MANSKKEVNDPDLNLQIWTRIAEETGVSVKMVGQIHYSVIKKRKDTMPIDSKNLTKLIIQDLLNNDNGPIKGILEYNGIKSSADFGVIVERLCNEGYFVKEENDNYEDFMGQFETASIDEYIRLQKIKKVQDWYKIVSYTLYLTGFVVVLSSYYVPYLNSEKTIWLGCGLGIVGWLLLVYRRKGFWKK